MKFDEAIEKCQPGQVVKHRMSGWTEHFVQYGIRDVDGVREPYWTAGWTVGGPLTKQRRPADADTSEEYSIYKFVKGSAIE